MVNQRLLVYFFLICSFQQISLISGSKSRYLLYDVNPGEGFNLRRDVYIRIANLVRFLNQQEKWTLVLPPWGRIYHWFTASHEAKIPWSECFSLESMNIFVPVMEFREFIKITPKLEIDEIYYLQSFPFDGADGAPIEWRDRLEKQDCQQEYHGYYKENGVWHGWFFGYNDQISGKSFSCLSVQMEAAGMRNFLLNETQARVIMFDRAETLIHGMYSEWSPEYWTGRRSMVFAERLHRLSLDFLRKHWPAVVPGSVDKNILSWRADWRHRRPEILSLEDTPAYVALHMRRMDFMRAHSDLVPSLRTSAEQALIALRKLKLKHLFVATDAPDEEVKTFREYFPPDIKVMRFESPPGENLSDGAVAIIDQIIASLSRHFIGTCDSTFSFRIQEEREILGFPPDSIYNCLCIDTAAIGTEKCRNPTTWRIQYEPEMTLPPVASGHTEL